MTGRNMHDPFAGFDLETRIATRAASCGISLEPSHVERLSGHARAVLRESDELHLTSIREPEEFVERHLGEAFEGAALLAPETSGELLDVGSGNGYPAVPLVAARPGLHAILAEASRRKAEFLRSVSGASVLEAQVQRPADLDGIGPFEVITSRAMGGWSKILPRLGSTLGEDGCLLVWCGAEMETVARRVVWRRLQLVERRALPGRDQSWVWKFQKVSAA